MTPNEQPERSVGHMDHKTQRPIESDAAAEPEADVGATRRQMIRRGGAAAGVLGAAGLLAACGSDSSSSKASKQATTTGSSKKLRIVTVWIGVPGAPFFVTTKNGALQAGKDMSDVLTSEYRETTSGQIDINELNRLFDTVVASKPDGIATFVIDPVAQKPHIEAAMKAGIPVILEVSGVKYYKQFGAIGFFGADNKAGSSAAAQRMKAEGVTNALVINGNPENPDVTDRYIGFKTAFEAGGGKIRQVPVRESDITGMEARIKAALLSTPGVNGVYSLGADSGNAALAAVQKANMTSKVKLANWDLSAPVLKAVAAGQILFAQDQQPFLDTYSSVVALYLYKKYGVVPVAPVVNGPSFITKDDAEQVIQLAAQGLR